MKYELDRIWKEADVACSRYSYNPWIFLDGLSKPTKISDKMAGVLGLIRQKIFVMKPTAGIA
jgi:hypothetical protein